MERAGVITERADFEGLLKRLEKSALACPAITPSEMICLAYLFRICYTLPAPSF